MGDPDEAHKRIGAVFRRGPLRILFNRGGCPDLNGLYLDVPKYAAFPISRSTDKLRSCRIISAKLANCFREVVFQARITSETLKSCG